MKKKATYINDLHFEHKAWKSQLDFQKEELKSFNRRLEEVVVRWTDQDILKQVEHYQNNFLRHHEVIDTLQHNINEREHALSTFAQDHPIAIDHVHFEDHVGLRKEVEDQDRIYNELKKEYFKFLTVAM